jgi:hypothetical protein
MERHLENSVENGGIQKLVDGFGKQLIAKKNEKDQRLEDNDNFQNILFSLLDKDLQRLYLQVNKSQQQYENNVNQMMIELLTHGKKKNVAQKDRTSYHFTHNDTLSLTPSPKSKQYKFSPENKVLADVQREQFLWFKVSFTFFSILLQNY